MKSINFKKFLFLPLLFLMIFTSCQDEVTEITDPNTEETLVANSNLANLMRFTSINDGSIDNIIDFANCLEVVLPVTVIVNDITITITSFEDLDLIEAIFDEFEDDINDIEIVFPITIISGDYTVIEIENQEALEDLIEGCHGEDEDDDDIECIDFQYPITISIFNTDFDIIETVTINNDEALYHFIDDLDGGVLASINYPITMILSDGSTLEVENNTELEAAINAAEDDCDEDDDYDWDDDDIEECDLNLAGLEEVLLECNIVANFYDESDLDENYLDFNTGGELIVNGTPAVTEVGTWDLSESASGYVLTINGLFTFDLLNGEWLLEGCDGNDIVFSQDTGSGIITMELEQDCVDIPGCGEADVIASLVECFWYAGTNLFDIFVAEEVYFLSDGTVEIYNSESGSLTTTGTWAVTSDLGSIYLNLEFSMEPYALLNLSWEMIQCEEDRLEFVNGDNSLVFEQDCSGTGSGTVEDLEGTVIEGQWIVANYNDSGVDETNDYNDFVFDFNVDGTVITTNGTDTVSGTWSAIIDSGQLKLVLDFGVVIPFDEFNDDWDVMNFVADRVALRDISGGSGETDILVFEKL